MKHHITHITLVNGVKFDPMDVDIETDNIEQVRWEYQQKYPDYQILLKYTTKSIDKPVQID